MATTTYRTVSDEMSWTDWSSPQENVVPGAPRSTRWIGLAVSLAVVAVLLAGIVFLLPPSAG